MSNYDAPVARKYTHNTDDFELRTNTISPQNDLAIARNESGKFASTSRLLAESNSKKLGNIFETQSPYQNLAPAANSYGNAAQQSFTNSFSQPVYVQVVEGDAKSQMWKTARSILSTLAVFVGLGYLIDMQMGGGAGGGGGGAGGGPRSVMGMRNYEIQPETDKKTFKDVRGVPEVKKELEEVVEYLKDPSKFTRLGGKLPKGMLLTGPPGTGKTLLAKAVAGEAGVPFFYASGSEFEELYVGVGARRVRELFAAARKRAPCIIFIDEIDAVGSTRQLKEQQSMKMTLNQLLVELDGFSESQGVIVLAATNFPETLDKALVRPGRFDRVVAVPLPDVRGRKEIISYYLEKIVTAPDVSAETVARVTTGMSGAELANLINVAAVMAASDDSKLVTNKHLSDALDRVIMGAERKSALMPEQVRRVTAFHEGGHALIALRTEGAMAIHKATIVPRGHVLGMVQQLPEEVDSIQMTKKQMIATMDILMGGRVAEEVVFGSDSITSGAHSDLVKATRLAREMVGSYGMMPGSPIGLLVVGEGTSNDTKRLVDIEVGALLSASYNRVKKLLDTHRTDLDVIASTLLEKETLTGSELRQLIGLKELPSVDIIADAVVRKKIV